MRDAYFLKATDSKTGASELYTLSPEPTGSIAAFWRPYEEHTDDTLYASAQGLKLGLERGKLIFAYFTGQGYCTVGGKTSPFTSDSYRPFFLDKQR